MVLTMDTTAIQEWGWRVAFGIGGIAAVVVFWLVHHHVDESLQHDVIEEARHGGAKRAGSMRELFLVQWRPLLVCFLVTMGGTVAFYTYSVNGPKMIQAAFAKGDLVTGTVINLAALTVLMLLQPIGGWLSDIVGRKTLLVFFGVGGVLETWVLILVLPQQTSAVSAFAILIGGFIILTGYTSINAIVKSERFQPTSGRWASGSVTPWRTRSSAGLLPCCTRRPRRPIECHSSSGTSRLSSLSRCWSTPSC